MLSADADAPVASDLSQEVSVTTVPQPELVHEEEVCEVDNLSMTQADASALLQSVMNAEAAGDTKNAWFNTHEDSGAFDDPLERELCEPTAVLKLGVTARLILIVNIAGNVVRMDVLKIFLRVLLFALALVCMWLALGSTAQPGGAIFATVTTILFGAVVGTLIAKSLGFPPLVGYILAGLIWSTTSWNTGVPQLFASVVRTAALTTILCRAGINFKWSIVKPVAANISLTGLLPQVTEIVTHAALARLLFNHSSWLSAILQGAIAAPASSAVVITVVTPLRNQGYSVTRGPSLMMFVSLAADSVIAVWLINFVLGLMYPTPGLDMPLWERIASAPIQILAGGVCGFVSGKIIVLYSDWYYKRNEGLTGGWKDIAERHTKRDVALFILLSQGALILLSNHIDLPGAGTVAAAVAAATISQSWLNEGVEDRKNELNRTLAGIWDVFMAPALFCLVGASVDISALLNKDFLPYALMCIGAGLATKCIVVVLMQTGTGLMFKEKIFFAIGFCSKATVQAALGGKFLDLAMSKWSDHGPEEATSAEAEIALAKVVQQIAVCSLLVGAIGSGITMKLTGPSLLMKDEDYKALQAEKKRLTKGE